MNRRHFLHLAQAACIAGAGEVSTPSGFAQPDASRPAIPLGVTMRVAKGQGPKAVGRVHELGFKTCQIGFVEQVSQQAVARPKDALAAFHIEATAMLAALPGPAIPQNRTSEWPAEK